MKAKDGERSASKPAGEDDVQLITADHVAGLLGVSERTIWRLASAGRIVGPIKVGRCSRWRLQEVKRWIAAGCPATIDSDHKGV
ncbi:MAG: helix-turn-helix domain-containing protein [Planctomycetia bacterium]|nr:helix-turn-helix domain-containing protein [Planctomycetia bacterium]